MAMLIRWQMAHPALPVPLVGRALFGASGGLISPAAYTSPFTMHGTIMIFFAVTPILIGAFGNFCIPLMIGARDMAFPTLHMLSVWTMAAATGTLTASFFVPLGAPQAGWTAYATLSTAVGTPGLGQTLWVVAIYLNGASSVMGAINYITTIIRERAPGMTWLRLPLTVWGFLMTSILNALFVPVPALSSLVYGHHMFTTGMSPLLGESFMVLTMIISVPAVLLFLNWLGTLWRGSIHLDTPMLYCLGLVFTFGVGGLTGLFLADIVADMYLHDTYFVVGHFHLIMAAAVLLAIFAGVTFWFPKMFGRMMNEPLGKLHFWLTIVSLNVVFGGQLVIGYAGMQRRLYDPSVYEFLRPLLPLNQLISNAAFVLGAAQLIFVGNFFWSLARGRRAPVNPWQVGTLEWSVPSPPPPHNFDVIPVVNHGPHELGNPLVRARLGRDWLGQEDAAELARPPAQGPEGPRGDGAETTAAAGAPDAASLAPEGTT